jgi:hypothetical protein
MDDYDKQRVGEQVEPGGRPKAPGRLELLQRFVNTWNHDLPAEWDRLGTAARTGVWLREKGLVSGSARVTTRDAARLRELREAIRALAVGTKDPPLPLLRWPSSAGRLGVPRSESSSTRSGTHRSRQRARVSTQR